METSPLICRANHWTGLYMITASVMKELIVFRYSYILTTRMAQFLIFYSAEGS